MYEFTEFHPIFPSKISKNILVEKAVNKFLSDLDIFYCAKGTEDLAQLK